MAATLEITAQNERDLRSANKEWKRCKDTSAKWSRGAKPPKLGIWGSQGHWWGTPETFGEIENTKSRPLRKASEMSNYRRKVEQNHNKFPRRCYENLNQGRVRSQFSAQEEIEDTANTSRSIRDLLPRNKSRKLSVQDDFLYSFDRTESPGRPLTLDVFIKTTGRETERLVEKEYEILDDNGEPLKGRKARRNLRRSATASGADSKTGKLGREHVEGDEDDFELV